MEVRRVDEMAVSKADGMVGEMVGMRVVWKVDWKAVQ